MTTELILLSSAGSSAGGNLLYQWGDNTWGQVGDGTATNHTTPQKIGIATDWNKISAGGDFVLATKPDNSL
jgi:alpha-tubulin suppressor-like RCC1 family protein